MQSIENSDTHEQQNEGSVSKYNDNDDNEDEEGGKPDEKESYPSLPERPDDDAPAKLLAALSALSSENFSSTTPKAEEPPNANNDNDLSSQIKRKKLETQDETYDDLENVKRAKTEESEIEQSTGVQE